MFLILLTDVTRQYYRRADSVTDAERCDPSGIKWAGDSLIPQGS